MALRVTDRTGTRVVSRTPFGVGERNPHQYRDMLRVAWENRDHLGYGGRIPRHGV